MLLLQRLIQPRKIKKKLSNADELWCELCLSLGGTIGELQSKMTGREFDVWCQYRSKYGPLNPVRMYDQGSALVASQINNSHGGKARAFDFMPYGKGQEEVLGEDEFISQLMATGRARVGR